MKTQNLLPLVTVIIPTKNAGKTLLLCLESLKKQTYKKLEIIVADGESKDNTISICKKFNVKILTVESHIERTTKKNLAAASAKGEYVYFIDADFELQSHVIEECVNLCTKNYDAIIVPEKVYGYNSFWSRCRQLEVLCYNGDDLVESPRFIKKHVFMDVKGFDEYEKSLSSIRFNNSQPVDTMQENQITVKIYGAIPQVRSLSNKYPMDRLYIYR